MRTNDELRCRTNDAPCDARRASDDNTCQHYPRGMIRGHAFTEAEIAAYALAHPFPPEKTFKAQVRAAMLAELLPGAIPAERTLDRICRQTEVAERLAAATAERWRALR